MKKVVGAMKNNLLKKRHEIMNHEIIAQRQNRRTKCSQCVRGKLKFRGRLWYTGRFDIVAQVSNTAQKALVCY